MGRTARVLQKSPRKSHHLSEVTVLERRVKAAEHKATAAHTWIDDLWLADEMLQWEHDPAHIIKVDGRIYTPEQARSQLVAWGVQPWAGKARQADDAHSLETAREIMQANEDMRQNAATTAAAKRPLSKQSVKEIVVLRSI